MEDKDMEAGVYLGWPGKMRPIRQSCCRTVKESNIGNPGTNLWRTLFECLVIKYRGLLVFTKNHLILEVEGTFEILCILIP